MAWFKKKKKFGIAFGGGGARGLAEIGAWKALEEGGIPLANMVAGTSVGSLIGACYALGYKSDEVLEYTNSISLEDFTNYRHPDGDLGEFIKSIVANREKIFSFARDSEIIENLAKGLWGDKTFDDVLLPFFAIAVDLKKGKEVILERGELAKACRASSSIPGVFTPTLQDDMILCDGYLLNNLPADHLKDRGMDVVLGMNITGNPYDGCNSAKFFDVLFSSIELMSVHGKIKNLVYCDVLVEPDLSAYSSYSMGKDAFSAMYQAGYQAMKEKLPQLRAALELN